LRNSWGPPTYCGSSGDVPISTKKTSSVHPHEEGDHARKPRCENSTPSSVQVSFILVSVTCVGAWLCGKIQIGASLSWSIAEGIRSRLSFCPRFRHRTALTYYVPKVTNGIWVSDVRAGVRLGFGIQTVRRLGCRALWRQSWPPSIGERRRCVIDEIAQFTPHGRRRSCHRSQDAKLPDPNSVQVLFGSAMRASRPGFAGKDPLRAVLMSIAELDSQSPDSGIDSSPSLPPYM